MLLLMGLPADLGAHTFGLGLETIIKFGFDQIWSLLGHKVDLYKLEDDAIGRNPWSFINRSIQS